MARFRRFRPIATLCCLFVLTLTLHGQFTANIQGVVEDQSGAGVAKASIQLVNVGTGVTKTANTDAAGNYRFVSIAPGNYKIFAWENLEDSWFDAELMAGLESRGKSIRVSESDKITTELNAIAGTMWLPLP